MSEPAELAIRPARPDERDALEDLQRRSSLALEEHRAQLEAEPDAVQLPIEMIERDEVTVDEQDGKVVGFSVLFIGDDEAELDGLFVEPRHWRMGVGSALVKIATHEARKRGLTLMVTANPSARKFYETCGFSLEGEAQTRFGPALRMSK